MTMPAYMLLEPENLKNGVVFASPHSGRDYPQEMLDVSVLDSKTIRLSEDAFVDEIFASAPELGSPLLVANMPRAYVDLNRAKTELDPALIKDVRGHGLNPRVASGLGVIPRVVANGRPIYDGKLPFSVAEHRLKECWIPYHSCLQGLLDRAREKFGRSVLIDCHSMPHAAVSPRNMNSPSPEIIIGDRFGAAAATDLVEEVHLAFERAGFLVARNTPFAGAYVTQHYGRPSHDQNAIQIEIDRSLYMNEATIERLPNFDDFCARIREVILDISKIDQNNIKLAAE